MTDNGIEFSRDAWSGFIARATRDFAPHEIILREGPIACVSHLMLKADDKVRRAFSSDASILTTGESVPFFSAHSQLFGMLHARGFRDANVRDILPLVHLEGDDAASSSSSSEGSIGTSTVMDRAIIASSRMIVCPFTSVVLGEAIYANGSRIGHSCAPNASYYFGNGAVIVVAAGANGIEAGEEVTVSWMTHAVECNIVERCSRRAVLRRRLGRECTCSKCGPSECKPCRCFGHYRDLPKRCYAAISEGYTGVVDHREKLNALIRWWNKTSCRRIICTHLDVLDLFSRRVVLHARTIGPDERVAFMLTEIAAAVRFFSPGDTGSSAPVGFMDFLSERLGDAQPSTEAQQNTIEMWIRNVMARYPSMTDPVKHCTGIALCGQFMIGVINAVWTLRIKAPSYDPHAALFGGVQHWLDWKQLVLDKAGADTVYFSGGIKQNEKEDRVVFGIHAIARLNEDKFDHFKIETVRKIDYASVDAFQAQVAAARDIALEIERALGL